MYTYYYQIITRVHRPKAIALTVNRDSRVDKQTNGDAFLAMLLVWLQK